MSYIYCIKQTYIGRLIWKSYPTIKDKNSILIDP